MTNTPLHLTMVLVLAIGGAAMAQAPDKPGSESTPADSPAAAMPHIKVDREARLVDVDARVVMREGKWIELVACSPNTKEHESLVVVLAKPSHIHLALLTLGLKPGHPMTVEKIGDGYKVHPPTGPKVAVSFVVTEDGKQREVPANQWVLNQKTDTIMADNEFLFAGSEFVNYEGKDIYMADLSGAVVSVVNFGDDLLSRNTTDTNDSDNQAWNANTPAIPPLGTDVILRLRPVEPAD